MKNRMHIRDENGQAMTEFAVVLPLLALLIFGIIQFGLMFNDYLTLTDAVRAGSRKAVVSRNAPDRVSRTVTAVEKSAPSLAEGDLQVEVASTWRPGEDATVTASYPYSINLLGMVVSSGRITSTNTERVE